jgi:hypothetical protein
VNAAKKDGLKKAAKKGTAACLKISHWLPSVAPEENHRKCILYRSCNAV